MARRYALNYDWARRCPVRWTEESSVTLRVDLTSAGDAVWEALTGWWSGMPREAGVAYSGGCCFPAPVRLSEGAVTAWITSSGEDAFDSVAHHAEELRGMAEAADPSVTVTWTELPLE